MPPCAISHTYDQIRKVRHDKTSGPNTKALFQISSYCTYATSDPEETLKVKPHHERHTCMKTSNQEKPACDRMIILWQNDSNGVQQNRRKTSLYKEKVSVDQTDFSTKDRETRKVSFSKLSLSGKQKEQTNDQIESNLLMNNCLRDV